MVETVILVSRFNSKPFYPSSPWLGGSNLLLNEIEPVQVMSGFYVRFRSAEKTFALKSSSRGDITTRLTIASVVDGRLLPSG
jgi:hypothetical protein